MLECRILGQGDDDLLVAFLKAYASTSMFLLSNFSRRGFERKGRPFEATYYGVFEKGVLKGVLSYAWNGFLGLKIPENIYAKPLFDFAKKSLGVLRGMTGASDEVHHFLKIMGKSPEDCSFFEEEKLMVLDLKQLKTPRSLNADFSVNLSQESDLDFLAPWRVMYECESFGEKESPELFIKARETVENDRSAKNHFVLRLKDKPCAYGGFNARFENLGQLGGIFTPPEGRNKGYAQVLIYLFLQKAFQEQGLEKCFLFTHTSAAFKAYQNLGFEEIGAYTLLRFRGDQK